MSVSSAEPLRVLLVKPYQRARSRIACPPLGLLYLASMFRQKFGLDVEVRLLDLMPDHARYFEAREVLQQFRPYVAGVSALNCKAEESGRLALMIQAEFPGTIVAYRRSVHSWEHRANLRDRRLRLDLRRRSGLVVSNCLSAVVSRRQNSNR